MEKIDSASFVTGVLFALSYIDTDKMDKLEKVINEVIPADVLQQVKELMKVR